MPNVAFLVTRLRPRLAQSMAAPQLQEPWSRQSTVGPKLDVRSRIGVSGKLLILIPTIIQETAHFLSASAVLGVRVLIRVDRRFPHLSWHEIAEVGLCLSRLRQNLLIPAICVDKDEVF